MRVSGCRRMKYRSRLEVEPGEDSVEDEEESEEKSEEVRKARKRARIFIAFALSACSFSGSTPLVLHGP